MMDTFLKAEHKIILDQIDPQLGWMELDLTNKHHYAFFLDKVNGLKAFEQKHPHLVPVLKELSTANTSNVQKLKTPLLNDEGYHEGPNDMMAIENCMFSASTNDNTRLDTNDQEQALAVAVIMAEYIQKKEEIIVVTELRDMTDGGKLLHTITDESADSYSYEGLLEAAYQLYYKDTPSEFLITSTFYCTEAPTNERKQLLLQAYVAKQSTFTLGANKSFVKSLTLNDPVIQECNKSKPDHLKVKIAYKRSDAVPDYDYRNEEQPFFKDNNEKILVRLKFSATVEAADGYYIKGINKELGYRMWLKNMVNGTVNNYADINKIAEIKEDFDINGRCIKMKFDFPEEWSNILDFEKIGYEPYTTVELYGSFSIILVSAKTGNNIPVGVSVKSDPKDTDNLNIRCNMLWIQWGCVDKDTNIQMYDKSTKRACEIKIGDCLRDENGRSVEVKAISTGKEYYLYSVRTENHHIRVTSGHIMSTEQGLLPAKQLLLGMKLQTISGSIIRWEPIIEIEQKCFYDDVVYNFEFAQMTLIIGNGIIIGDSMLQNRDRPKSPLREVLHHEN